MGRGARRSAVIISMVAALLFSLLGAQPAGAGTRTGTTPAVGTASALIVYDDAGADSYGWISEAYATQVANLASRFGTTKAIKVSEYTSKLLDNYTATIYVGALYRDTLPDVFRTDVLATTKPVVWLFSNISTLGAYDYPGGLFVTAHGWRTTGYTDNAVDPITSVRYKGRDFGRHLDAGSTIGIQIDDASKATALATSTSKAGVTRTWAVRSGNLTYIGDMPLSYLSENDRYLIFSDLLFDALAPATVERHRALVRLEDIGPNQNPQEFRAIVDFLSSRKIPFSFGVYPRYKDPAGVYNGGVAQEIRMKDRPALVAEIKNAISKGGVALMHGWTHQFDGDLSNPYNGVSGDDFEFYAAHEDASLAVIYDGPVPIDSDAWARSRMDGSANDFKAAGLATPTIFEFPHYAGSAVDYKAVGSRFTTRYERSLYPEGVLRGGTPNYDHLVGQFFPYVVKDVYGTKVLPENLGNYEPTAFNQHPPRLPAEIVASANLNLAVRDGFASFFYHPFLGVAGLKEIVDGVQAAGYTFVSPTTL